MFARPLGSPHLCLHHRKEQLSRASWGPLLLGSDRGRGPWLRDKPWDSFQRQTTRRRKGVTRLLGCRCRAPRRVCLCLEERGAFWQEWERLPAGPSFSVSGLVGGARAPCPSPPQRVFCALLLACQETFPTWPHQGGQSDGKGLRCRRSRTLPVGDPVPSLQAKGVNIPGHRKVQGWRPQGGRALQEAILTAMPLWANLGPSHVSLSCDSSCLWAGPCRATPRPLGVAG